MATQPLLSWGPKNEWNCKVATAFFRITNKGDKLKSGSLTRAFLGAQTWAELLRNLCVLWVPEKRTKSKHNAATKKNKKTGCFCVPTLRLDGCRLPIPGIEIETYQPERHRFTTRVWVICDKMTAQGWY